MSRLPPLLRSAGAPVSGYSLPFRSSRKTGCGAWCISLGPQKIFLKIFTAQKGKVILAGVSIIGIDSASGLFHVAHHLASRLPVDSNKPVALRRGISWPCNRSTIRSPKKWNCSSKSFSQMALSLHERSEYIREFATYVSHEFKTPLTAIQGAGELLLGTL